MRGRPPYLLFLFPLLLGLLGGIIYWSYELRIREEWSGKAELISKHLERALINKQLELRVLAQGLTLSITQADRDKKDAAAKPSFSSLKSLHRNPLLERLGISEIIVHSVREDKTLFEAAAWSRREIWRATLFDFFRTQQPQSAMELTECGPRVLEMEPLELKEGLCALEARIDLQKFLEEFARSEEVNIAFLVPEERWKDARAPSVLVNSKERYKVLSASNPAAAEQLSKLAIKKYLGSRMVGLSVNGKTAMAVMSMDDFEYRSTIVPSPGGNSAVFIWMDYGRELAGLSAERRQVLLLLVLVLTVALLGVALLQRIYRRRYRWQIGNSRESLRLANEKLQGEVIARQRAEESLRGIADEQYRRRKCESDLLANLAHKLKLNASATIGFVEILREEKAKQHDGECLDSLVQLSEKLFSLAENLDLWSRRDYFSQATARAILKHLSLKEVVNRAFAGVKALAARKGVNVMFSLEAEALIEGEPLLLEAAVKNILANAVRFSRRSGSVQVALTRLAGGVELLVRDNGTGIPREVMERLFDSPGSVVCADAEGNEGLGLGLAVVKWVAQLHQAQVRITSDEKQGCVVRLMFPVKGE